MQSRTQLYWFLIFSFFLNACTKPSGEDNNQDLVKKIVNAYTEPSGSGQISSFQVRNEKGNLLWWRSGFTGILDVFSGNNKLYVMGGQPDYSQKFIAYNLETGEMLWSKIGGVDRIVGVYYQNDTLYCTNSHQVTSSLVNGYVKAYNANTGDLYWEKQVVSSAIPYLINVVGSKLYFYYTDQAVNGRVGSCDLNTREVNPGINFGLPIFSTFKSLVYHDYNFNRAGSANLTTFNRNTGALLWNRNDRTWDNPVFYEQGNTLYATSQENVIRTKNGFYALDPATGNTKWQALDSALQFLGAPYVHSNKAFVSSLNTGNSVCVKCFDSRSGAELWSSTIVNQYANESTFVYEKIALDNKLYVVRKRYGAGAAILESKMIQYNASNGAIEDSILLPNNITRFILIGASGKSYKNY